MPSTEELKAILLRSMNAPSGDNSQPWEFRVMDGTIELYNLKNRDETLYNFRQHGSYLAHGALMENICLIAQSEGYGATITPFPGTPDCTARIHFTKAETQPNPLADAIAKRTTNRKPYKKIPMDPEHKDALIAAIRPLPGVSLMLIENRAHVNELAKAVSVNERLLMENRPLHDFLFSMIRWSREEERARPGLYIETMELPPPVKLQFRYILTHWPVVRLMNMVGFSRLISKQTAQLYQSASAFGAVVIENTNDASFLQAGRALERAWLAATNCGLSLQPVTALPYLVRRVHAGAAEAFTQTHQELIRQGHARIAESFGLPNDTHIAMLFRIGYDGEPTARSSKLPPVIRH